MKKDLKKRLVEFEKTARDVIWDRFASGIFGYLSDNLSPIAITLSMVVSGVVFKRYPSECAQYVSDVLQNGVINEVGKILSSILSCNLGICAFVAILLLPLAFILLIKKSNYPKEYLTRAFMTIALAYGIMASVSLSCIASTINELIDLYEFSPPIQLIIFVVGTAYYWLFKVITGRIESVYKKRNINCGLAAISYLMRSRINDTVSVSSSVILPRLYSVLRLDYINFEMKYPGGRSPPDLSFDQISGS